MSWNNADCHQLLTDGLRKSDERDQELQDAKGKIEVLERQARSMQSVISASDVHGRLLEAERKGYRLLCALYDASLYAMDRDQLAKFCGDAYKAENTSGEKHPPYHEIALSEKENGT